MKKEIIFKSKDHQFQLHSQKYQLDKNNHSTSETGKQFTPNQTQKIVSRGTIEFNNPNKIKLKGGSKILKNLGNSCSCNIGIDKNYIDQPCNYCIPPFYTILHDHVGPIAYRQSFSHHPQPSLWLQLW